jgi:hypothetical protein
MTQEIINIGAQPNDGEGDPLRTAFGKINNNFTQLFSTGFFTSNAYSYGDTAAQVIFEYPIETFTQGIIQINSNDTASSDTQNITLNVSVVNNGSRLKWNGHNTLFSGTELTGYEMDIFESNVRILVNPILDIDMFHFISAQVTWTGVPVPGLNLLVDGTANTVFIDTEVDFNIETENQVTV